MRRQTLLATCAVIVGALLSQVGCGRPFQIETPNGFAEIHELRSSPYAYRASTPDGVVIAVRVIEDEERGDLDFWVKTLSLSIRDGMGYALLSVESTQARDGTPGKTLRFGHDEDGKPYDYSVSIFMAQGRLFLFETGGPRELTAKAKANTEWAGKSLKVRCDSFVAPVFASRTCNRW